MDYNEALCFRKKDGENPIDGVFINLSKDDINGLKQEEVDGVLEILRNNPRLKLYFYDSDSKDHIVRFCDNEKGKEILSKGVEHIKKKNFFDDLSRLTQRKYEEGVKDEKVPDKKSVDFGSAAKELLKTNVFADKISKNH